MKKKHIKQLKAAFQERFHRDPTKSHVRRMKKMTGKIRRGHA